MPSHKRLTPYIDNRLYLQSYSKVFANITRLITVYNSNDISKIVYFFIQTPASIKKSNNFGMGLQM